jgi:hypothetical protein
MNYRSSQRFYSKLYMGKHNVQLYEHYHYHQRWVEVDS